MASQTLSFTACAHSAGEQAILEAAVRLFSEQGFDGVSMRAVALEAGVSKSNIYHHFESKEALYLAIWQHSAENLAVMVRGLAESEGDFETRLREFARNHLAHLFRNATTMRLMMREMMFGTSGNKHHVFEHAVGEVLETLIGIFENGQRAGLLRPGVDPALCAFLMLGTDTFYLLTDDMRHYPPMDIYTLPEERFSDDLMDIILHGMLAETGARSDQK